MARKRTVDQIVAEIQGLFAELSASLGKEAHVSAPIKKAKAQVFSGPSGGIRLLIGETFFKQPKTLPQVCDRLRQEGFNYSQQAVSVALLRLVRDRTMVRLKAPGDGKETWVYAERK